MFCDRIKIKVQAGNGGQGCESYDHKSPVKIIPHGGDGGRGGDVIIVSDANVSDLGTFNAKQKYSAANGMHGSSHKKEGRGGENLILRVPCGTAIWNTEQHLLIRELVDADEQVIVVRGGHGGRGNSGHRTRSDGEHGEMLEIELDFRLVVDVALVGMPNSGKSALLRALSGAKVKSEIYPFSTKHPQLGVMESDTYQQAKVCELPGLIQGSSEGKGVGNHFLKHLQRARGVIYLLDPASQFEPDLEQQLVVLETEVNEFNEKNKELASMVVVNKADLVDDNKRITRLHGKSVFYMSEKDPASIQRVKETMFNLLETYETHQD